MISLVLVFSVDCVLWSAATRKSKSDQCQKLIYWSKPVFGCETVFTFLYILSRAELGRHSVLVEKDAARQKKEELETGRGFWSPVAKRPQKSFYFCFLLQKSDL